MSAAPASGEALLDVRDLVIAVTAPLGKVTIVNGVSFAVPARGAVALVGESGSGKSLTAFSLMQLLPAGAHVERGSVRFEGTDLVGLPDRALRKLRGARIAMVFQEPSTALNPVYTIGDQIAEAVRLHESVSRREAMARAEAWLTRVGMPAAKRAKDAYPHELSGGMKQRALLAIALVTGPRLLIADEPTTALDRTLEAQVLDVLRREREERGMALVLVSHDLTTVAEVTDRTLVFYAGEIVEDAPTRDVLREPAHPYTAKLVTSIPDPTAFPARALGRPSPKLPVLKGAPPAFTALPKGCRFAPRCERSFDRCFSEHPPLYERGDRTVRCFLYEDGAP